jgi:hypothetical protein
MMIDTNRNANYFPHTYHIRSRLTANGVRQRFSYAVEAYLRKQPAVETAVLAALRTETAISRSEIIATCRDYLLEQADSEFPTACPTPPTDDDIALATPLPHILKELRLLRKKDQPHRGPAKNNQSWLEQSPFTPLGQQPTAPYLPESTPLPLVLLSQESTWLEE